MIRPYFFSARLTAVNDTRSSWGFGTSNNTITCEEGFDLDDTVAYVSTPNDRLEVSTDMLPKLGDNVSDEHRDARRYASHIFLEHTQEIILVSLGRSI